MCRYPLGSGGNLVSTRPPCLPVRTSSLMIARMKSLGCALGLASLLVAWASLEGEPVLGGCTFVRLVIGQVTPTAAGTAICDRSSRFATVLARTLSGTDQLGSG